MASRKPRSKKKQEFKASEQRSAFLYGKPNTEKRLKLQRIQDDYSGAVSAYAALIMKDDRWILQLLKRDRKDPGLRRLEKDNRIPTMSSAFGQSAFDYAFDRLATRADDIKAYAYKEIPSIFTSSKILFADCVLGKGKDAMCADIQEVIDNILAEDERKRAAGMKPKEGKTDFYQKLIDEIRAMKQEDFDLAAEEARWLYREGCGIFKVPQFGKVPVQLVSTLFTLEESDDIKAPYVINITDPAAKKARIEVPLDTSENSLRRLKQYGAKKPVTFTLMANGWVKVTVAFEKKHRTPETGKYKGVDIGTKDMFYPFEGEPAGTFDKCFKYYKEAVEPALAGVSKIRNAKRAVLHYLRRHKKTLPEEAVKFLRNKADRLEKMLRTEQASGHKLNKYHAMQGKEIKDSVQAYIRSLGGDKTVCTVLELLDIREFNKSKYSNSMLSMFARGSAAKKLMDTLNWMGYPYLQVEPAYTSQCCPVCSYTDKANREEKEFHCRCCGYKDDADHVGSVNIASRATDTEIQALCGTLTGQKRRDEIRKLLLDRNSGWRKLNGKTEADPAA